MQAHLKHGMGCLAILAAIALAGCGAPDPIDTLVLGERGRVVRIIDGDALVLDTGQSVRLVAIEAPAPPWRDRTGQPFADEAARILEDLSLGRAVRLYYAGLSRDRYDRALAHVVTDDSLGPKLWINRELVARGAARVRVYPDTARGADGFIALEAQARGAAEGLWDLPAYKIAPASDLDGSERGFMLVEGILADPEWGASPGEDQDQRRGGPPLCTRRLLASNVSIEVAMSAGDVCDLTPGARVIARGYVRANRIDVTHRLNITIVDR
ncbi:MAG: thermonuclease family protein [Pseudomonadota bacterium]